MHHVNFDLDLPPHSKSIPNLEQTRTSVQKFERRYGYTICYDSWPKDQTFLTSGVKAESGYSQDPMIKRIELSYEAFSKAIVHSPISMLHGEYNFILMGNM